MVKFATKCTQIEASLLTRVTAAIVLKMAISDLTGVDKMFGLPFSM